MIRSTRNHQLCARLAALLALVAFALLALPNRAAADGEVRAEMVPGEILIYTESDDEARRAALVERGATVVRLPEVAPAAVLADLHARGVRSLLVEGGGEALASFAESGHRPCYLVHATVQCWGRRVPQPHAKRRPRAIAHDKGNGLLLQHRHAVGGQAHYLDGLGARH